MKASAFCLLAAFTLSQAMAQKTIPLYQGEIPNSKPSEIKEEKSVDKGGSVRYGRVSTPSLEICLPEKAKANGAAVLIIPGGGYRIVSYTNEGTDIAAEFNKMGVAAFILKYRLPSDETMQDKSTGPLQDAQQAMSIIRGRAAEWNVNPQKVGVIGFSAGGHLASTLGTHLRHSYIANDQVNVRPDFMVLVYPVINLSDSLMHKGSRDNLLGVNPDPGQIALFSNDKQINEDTPPTMLIHASDDRAVKVQNSLRFYEGLISHNISAEMHIYPKGGHGFGIRPGRAPDHWTDRIEHWLKGLGILNK